MDDPYFGISGGDFVCNFGGSIFAAVINNNYFVIGFYLFEGLNSPAYGFLDIVLFIITGEKDADGNRQGRSRR